MIRELPQHLRDPRPAQAGPLHVRAAGGLPDRLSHPDAGRRSAGAARVHADRPQRSFLGFVNTFTGGSLEKIAVFALGIMPYITASIILQLLTVVWPYLEKLSKEGELGRRKITQYTRYGTVVISIIQGTGIALFLEAQRRRAARRWCPTPGWGFRAHDRDHADHRHGLRHVAGRADQRARHRQRHLADHLRRHRGRPDPGDRHDGRQHASGAT